MREIMAEDQPFIRHEHSIDEGLELFEDQPFKREIIEAVGRGQDEVDAAADADGTVPGVHLLELARLHRPVPRPACPLDRCGSGTSPSCGWPGPTGGATRSASSSSASTARRGSRTRRWPTISTGWRRRRRRDHRKLGAELDLFSFPEEIGSGLAVFHPKGGTVRRLMEDYSYQRHRAAGYEFVTTPHITKAELFETSGHLDWFADGMFPPMELDGGQQLLPQADELPVPRAHLQEPATLVPRAAPPALRVRDRLPVREVGGGARADPGPGDDPGRCPHLLHPRPDGRRAAHHALNFVLSLLRDFGLEEFYLELSTRPEGKAVGTPEEWEEATEALRTTALAMGLELTLDEGGGAFYGPKISVQARDAIGRTHQMSTIQLDFQTPQRFEAEYIGADNGRHRPIMIHRALFGSVERFFAILLEHYAGALPTWLSPEQVRVLGVRDDHETYADKVADRLAGGRGPGHRRPGRRAAGRPDPQGQGAQDPLHPGGGGRRCGRRDGGGEPPGERTGPSAGWSSWPFTEVLETEIAERRLPEATA